MADKLNFRSLIFLALFGFIFSQELISRELVLRKVDRKIDITSQLVKISTKLNFENIGNNQQTTKSFLFVLTPNENDNLSFISATTAGTDLKIAPASLPGDLPYKAYKINFKSPLANGKSVNVEVETIFSNLLTPYPASIHQGEKQLVQYAGNHYYLSCYTAQTQSATVSLLSPNVISYSRLKPTSHVDSSINYGPYEIVDPFSYDAMKIHYENNSPFMTVTNLERVIELSHWGNIAVEETIDILHTGALLKGSFSRYDYQREHNAYSSIKAFKTILPASARDVYYRDEIGNISTSHMRVLEDSVELDLRPRFPLFGGWKTHYTIGYNIPSYENLYYSGDKYVLKMRILDHIFDDMVVENLQVKIILPEGVKEIKLSSPYAVNRGPDEVHYTYLDTFGRTVINFNKKNLIENHIQDMEIGYSFPSFYMLQEPFLVVSAFFLLFFVVIIYVRLDLTLSKDESTEAKMRISSHCEMVHAHCDKRATVYERIEEEMTKLKSSKDIGHAQIAIKKLLVIYKEETNAVHELAAKIKLDHPEYSEKVYELQKHDKSLMELLQQQVVNVEKMVSGKMNKQNYLDADSNLNTKKEAALNKLKGALNTI